MAVSTLVVESGMVLTACMGYAEWGNELSEGEDGDEEGGKEGREEDEEEEEWKESGKEGVWMWQYEGERGNVGWGKLE